MDCRETQALLTAFHDGELPGADRARVTDHLRGCPECGARLADLARVDAAAGVPDPGPAYWDRFNARVMDRVEREGEGPNAAVLRPKHGWVRQQLRYLVPAVAAAAMVVVVVRYGGLHTGATTMARDGQVPGQAGTPRDLAPRPPSASQVVLPAVREPAAPESAAVARREPEESSRVTGDPAAPPPVISDERSVAAMRGERDRTADRSLLEAKEKTAEDLAAAPAAVGVPSPPMAFRGTPAESPRVTAADGMASRVQDERKRMGNAVAPAAEPHLAAKAESASGMRIAKDTPAEAPPAESLGKKARSKEDPSPLASAPPADGQGRPSAGAGRDAPGSVAPADSPCELARTLADQKRWREAEAAQRACLARDRSAPAQEKGLVYLAELLDRQVRFAEADKVITEVELLFPQSRPLDLYRQQRPMVQKRQIPVPDTR